MDDRYPARVSGPLAAQVHAFRAELVRAGYTARVSRDNAYVLACLSRWLEAEGLAAEELTADHLERFHVTVQPANSGKASTQLA